MSSDESKVAPVIVGPDGGDTVFLVGDTYTIILSGEQTGGTFTLLEALVPPDTGPPPHRHNAEDETFMVLEGSITFHLDGATHHSPAGTVIFVPKGVVHSFRNSGRAMAKLLFMYSPAGMEKMFAEIGKPGERHMQAPPLCVEDVAAMIAVAGKYKFTIT